MKRMVIPFLVLGSLYASSVKLSLVDFVEFLQVKTDKSIILDEKLEDDNFYLMTDKSLEQLSINDFKKFIYSKHLKLYELDKYYYVTFKNTEFDNDFKLRTISLKHNSYKTIKKIIDLYNTNNQSMNKNATANSINIVDYIDTTNTIIFLAKDEDYNYLKSTIKENDKNLHTALLKITISETNLNELNRKGFNYKGLTQIIDTNSIKSYVSFFSASSDTNIINSSKTFYSFLDFLSEKNITNIKASPFLTIKNGVETNFSIVENIPYLTKSESYNDTNKRESNSYNYKDVGLKINILPIILKNKLDFDLEISIEDILDNNSLTPKTSKKFLKGSYSLNKNEVLILSGINKNTAYDLQTGIPLLKDIPIIKSLFSWKSKNILKNSLLITIEYINNDDFDDGFDLTFLETLKKVEEETKNKK